MICNVCHLEKPLETFHPNRLYKTGYSPTCQDCFIAAIPAMLICTRCGIEKPLEDYARARKRRTGRQQPCNTCRYPQHSSRVPQWLKSSWVCHDCGIEKPLEQFCKDKRRKSGYAQPCKPCFQLRYYHPIHKPPAPIKTSLTCRGCGIEKPIEAFKKEPRCKSGHTQPCKACHAKEKRERRQANPEHARSVQQKRTKKNRQKLNQQMREWRNRGGNAERLNAIHRAKRAANPKAFREQERKHVPKKLARIRERRAAGDPIIFERERIHGSRRAARRKALPHTFTATERQFMLQYFDYACAVCGNEEGFLWTIAGDHWIPISSPQCPGTIATNMIPLCHTKSGQGAQSSCNNTKYNRDPLQWLTDRVGPRKAKAILKKIEAYFDIVRQRMLPQTGD